MSIAIGIAASAIAVGGAVGAFFAPLLGRRAATKNADAAAREAASNEWEVHNESLHRYADGLATRLAKVDERLDTAEGRAEVFEQRANRAEYLYRITIEYLRHLAAWFTSRWPDEELPTPPVELHSDLPMRVSLTSDNDPRKQ